MKTESPGGEYEVSDPLSVAINTTRGRAFETFVHFVEQDSKKFAKKLKGDARAWETDTDGGLGVVYQEKESEYHARSFEDAFIHLNKDFIKDNKANFKSLKNKSALDEDVHDAYDLAEKCVDKKTLFALDILFNSDEKLSNWKIPSYIRLN